jgi:hypothetical protein
MGGINNGVEYTARCIRKEMSGKKTIWIAFRSRTIAWLYRTCALWSVDELQLLLMGLPRKYNAGEV